MGLPVLGWAGAQGIVGGLITAPAGLLGGYAGVKVGEHLARAGPKTQNLSFVGAVASGAAIGAGVAAANAVALSLLLGTPVSLATAALFGTIGAFSGAVGALSGSRRASTRDGAYGGMISGALAHYLGAPGALAALCAAALVGTLLVRLRMPEIGELS